MACLPPSRHRSTRISRNILAFPGPNKKMDGILVYVTSTRGIKLLKFLFALLVTVFCYSVILWLTRSHRTTVYKRYNDTSDLGDPIKFIPRRIHQTYVSDHVPMSYAPYIKSWVDNHPDWEYWFWSNSDCLAFIADHYPQYLKMYESYSDDLLRSDVIRYFVLFHYGGVYADMDMESLKPIEPLLKNHTCFFSTELHFQSALLYNLSSIAMNALMGCKKHHMFFNFIISRLPEQQRPTLTKSEATFLTGPLMLQKSIEYYSMAPRGMADNFTILPDWVFMPNMDRPITSYLLENKCKRKDGHPLWKKACHDLRWHSRMSQKFILRGAYGDHKFLHLGHRQTMRDNIDADIYSIAPLVYRYQTKGRDRTIFIVCCACLFHVFLVLLIILVSCERKRLISFF